MTNTNNQTQEYVHLAIEAMVNLVRHMQDVRNDEDRMSRQEDELGFRILDLAADIGDYFEINIEDY